MSSLSDETSFNVYGTTVRLVTTLKDFSQFVRHNYLPFLSETLSNYDITVCFSREAIRAAEAALGDLCRVGDDVAVGTRTLCWKNAFGFRVVG